ncbi:DUF397 domain-containing protein [Streptomyces heliomycini]|uniref:DUF397 domain-containing protein n=1 Tax=Streptomyces heliomycini TaxID=284032 RepID=A0ABV5L6K5_9ACTN|nr:DUF397 domain-containing protein [Streptomyces sp. XY152]
MWFTSSYSNGAGGECVECAITRDRALVRDSKSTEGAVVAVERHAWHSFVQGLKGGTWPR